MANKRFKDGKWRYKVQKKSLLPKPIYLSFTDEKEGDAYVEKLERMLEQGIVPEGFKRTPGEIHTFSSLVSQYDMANVIKPDDKKILYALNKDYARVTLGQMTYSWIEMQILKFKRQDNLSPSTIRHKIGAIARMLDWAAAKGYREDNPARMLPRGYAQYNEEDAKYVKVKEDVEKDRRLEPGEEEKIREVLSGEILFLFEVALESAMRLSEIYTLGWDQIDLNKNTIFLRKTKNGNKRQVPMSSVLHRYLEENWEAFSLDYEKSAKITAKFSKQFARKVDPVAPGFTFHCLRHEATSRLFERTNLIEAEIQKITGHSSSRMLARYANLRGSNLAARLW